MGLNGFNSHDLVVLFTILRPLIVGNVEIINNALYF